jgi:hypothetical protein
MLQHQLYPGPLRPTRDTHAVYSTRCAGWIHDVIHGDHYCGDFTINGEAFCYRCKDPDGYTERLRKAQQEARQRCLRAYPVCRRCGKVLTQAQVDAGQTKHNGSSSGCILPGENEPLAQRS